MCKKLLQFLQKRFTAAIIFLLLSKKSGKKLIKRKFGVVLRRKESTGKIKRRTGQKSREMDKQKRIPFSNDIPDCLI